MAPLARDVIHPASSSSNKHSVSLHHGTITLTMAYSFEYNFQATKRRMMTFPLLALRVGVLYQT